MVYFFEFIFYQWKSQVKKQLFPILLPREQKQTFKEGTPKPKKKKKNLIIQNFSSPNSNQFNLSTITSTTTSLNPKILDQLWILNR